MFLAYSSVMGKFLFLVTAALAFSQIGADPFTGVYAGKELQLELRPAGAGSYTGTLQVQGQSFPVTARAAAQQLTGTFTSGANSFSFQATLKGSEMRLVSDNNEYLLARRAPVNTVAHTHPKGFSVRPAPGWTAQNNEQGVLLIPAGASNEEVYVAAYQDGYSAAEESKSVQQLSQAFLQNGGHVRRAGERQQLARGAAYYWEVADPQSGKIAGLKIYFLPQGTRANVIIAFGVADRLRPRDPDLAQMLATIQTFAPPPVAALSGGPLADNTPVAQQWLRKLQGKMIRQFHAYQGMSSDKRHMLNADGTYWFRSNSMVSVDVPGASASSTGRNRLEGRWRIRDSGGQAVLQIQYNDGDTGQYRLTQDARNWYMNGEKAFAVDPE